MHLLVSTALSICFVVVSSSSIDITTKPLRCIILIPFIKNMVKTYMTHDTRKICTISNQSITRKSSLV